MSPAVKNLTTTTRRKVTVYLSIAIGVVIIGFLFLIYTLATSK